MIGMRKKKKAKRPSHKLSDHFSKRDFTCKESGKLKISLGLVGALELIRSKANQRINIIKGYESLEAAEKKGKAKRNHHTTGIAADITIDNFTATETFKLATEIPEIMGIGLNLEENYVHVDTRKAKERSLWVEKNDDEIELTDENKQEWGL
tara:strand:+ start:4045 stop:4500 length:456 start_codon:yes stop_codon:yes gene_type:complete